VIAENRQARLRALLIDGEAAGRPGDGNHPPHASCLDARTEAFVHLAALVTQGAPASSYRRPVEAARAGGASDDEIVDILIAVAPRIGLARLVMAVPGLALAVGYDIDAALEGLDDLSDRR
jgi:4-carboxymuconolactone decarboxylase